MNKRIFVLCGITAAGVALFVLWLAVSTLVPAAFAQGGNQTCPLTKDQAQTAATAFRAMDAVFQSPRCLNCHGTYGDLTTNPQTKHPGGYIPLDRFDRAKDPSKECVNCHDLGGSKWKLPPEHLFFTGKTDVALCKQMRTMGNGIDFLNHLDGDKLINIGFQGNKGQSDLPANPPPISKENFLGLAEKWVSAVYLSSNQNDWAKGFPGGIESTCGCDANTFQEAAAPAPASECDVIPDVSGVTKSDRFPPRDDINIMGTNSVVCAFDASPIGSLGVYQLASEQDAKDTIATVRGQEALAWQPSTVYGDPGWGFEVAASSPTDLSQRRHGAEVWFTRCNYLVHGDAGFQGSKPRAFDQLRSVATQVDKNLATNPLYGCVLPQTEPAPPPNLATIEKVDSNLEVEVRRAGTDFNGPWETGSQEGKELHFGDVVCFKGFGPLTLKWWDGSTITVRAIELSGLAMQCLEVELKHPDPKAGPGAGASLLHSLWQGIRYQVDGHDNPSAFHSSDDQIEISVKGTTFITAKDSTTGASIVCAEEGVVHITPKNAALAPFDLTAGNQVMVTDDSVSPITPGCTLPNNTTLPQPNTTVKGMTLQAPQRYVTAGDDVLIPVWIIHSEYLANLNFALSYDPAILQLAGDLAKGNILDNALFKANPNQPGSVLVGVAQTTPLKGTGTVINLPFRVVGKPGDSSPLFLNVTTINDANGGNLGINRIHGTIIVVNDDGTLPPVNGGTSGGSGGSSGGGSAGSGGGGAAPAGILNGDCDGSGVVNELDALCALEMSVGLRPPRLFVDSDKSGDVTSRDAVLILQRAVGK